MIKLTTNYFKTIFERKGSSHIISMIGQVNSFMHTWVSPTNNVDSIIDNKLDQSYVILLLHVCYYCHWYGPYRMETRRVKAMIINETVWYRLLFNANGWKLNAGSRHVSRKIDFRISFNVYVNFNLYNLHFIFDMITCCWNLNFKIA